jgi:cell division septation protein DedD
MSTDVRDPRGLTEDGFHEIQLSGKQLVFLFMATTVVSIVIFICGVLVGRGVRADGPNGGLAAFGAVAERQDQSAPSEQGETAEGPPADHPPPPTDELVRPDEFGYHDRLQAEAAPVEDLDLEPPKVEAPKETAKPAPRSPASPAQARATPAGAAATAVAPAARPAGAWTVQVTALRQRRDAEAMAKRLVSRGYDAYVDAGSGGVAMFRVRVGSFKDRQEAERMKQRLAREEKFNPFITK